MGERKFENFRKCKYKIKLKILKFLKATLGAFHNWGMFVFVFGLGGGGGGERGGERIGLGGKSWVQDLPLTKKKGIQLSIIIK